MATYTKTLKLKVKPEAYAWLNEAASEVNTVWNWAAETSTKAATRTDVKRKWMSGYDLCNLSAGASEYFERIGSATIQRVCCEYAAKRQQFRKLKLRFRASGGSKRALGWIPFKSSCIRKRGKALRFCGKAFRVFDSDKLEGVKWKQGNFAQDAVGDWFLCLPVEVETTQDVAPKEAVGVDLGLKAIATTSDGDVLEAGRWTHRYADKLAMAQRRGHKKQAKRIHRKVARCRADALHKFSRKLVNEYQIITIGNVSSSKLAKTKMAKSVMDSGWGMLKAQLISKGQQAGRSVEVVDEAFTTRACSQCGTLTGPQGLRQLSVREWTCTGCGAVHDRDINAARNILRLRHQPLSAGTRLEADVCIDHARQPSHECRCILRHPDGESE